MAAPSDSFDWTDTKIDQLRQLWSEGHSTAEIGRRMNISKNAVVGKAGRIGLSRPSPILRGGGLPKPPELRGHSPKPGKTALPVGTMLKVLKLPAYLAPEKPKSQGPVTKCCFPIGFPKEPGFRFCGAVSAPGYPYCGPHCTVAYVPLTKWRRQNGIRKADAELSVDL